MLHVYVQLSMSMLHVRRSCVFMSISKLPVYVRAASLCPCCLSMSMMHVHVSTCMSMSTCACELFAYAKISWMFREFRGKISLNIVLQETWYKNFHNSRAIPPTSPDSHPVTALLLARLFTFSFPLLPLLPLSHIYLYMCILFPYFPVLFFYSAFPFSFFI